MIANVPKIEMTQYFFDDVELFDKADDFHLSLTFGTHKWKGRDRDRRDRDKG
jgi:hypothetical protein